MPVSKVDVANGALQKLGASRIEALDQDDPNARSMAAAYDGVRRSELRKYVWSFAIRRASLASDGQTEWGDWYRYPKPNDYLRLIRDDETSREVDWRDEGDYILSADTGPLYLKYVADIDDPNKYDSLFVEAMSSKMAAETCIEITGSTNRKESLERDYEMAIREAKRIGAIEKPAQEFPEDSWIATRR